MKVNTSKLTETTQGFCDIIDITAKVAAQVRDAEIKDGLVALFVTGSTAALTTIEHEPGLVQDLKEFVEKLIPSNRRYHHDDRWGDDNGFSHLRAFIVWTLTADSRRTWPPSSRHVATNHSSRFR